MLGLIETYHPSTGRGEFRGSDGQLYPFLKTNLSHRSKEPRPQAQVAARLKHGVVTRMIVVSHRRQWDWIAHVFEALLYLTFAMFKSQ